MRSPEFRTPLFYPPTYSARQISMSYSENFVFPTSNKEVILIGHNRIGQANWLLNNYVWARS